MSVSAVPGSESFIEGSLICSDFVANITSADYDDVDAAGFRPAIAFSVQFRCEL